MNLSFKQKISAVSVAIVLIVGAATAIAFWTSSGTGSGTAGTGTTATVTINQTSPAIVDMGPGVAAEALSGTFTTTGAKPAYVGQVTPVVTGTSNVGCTSADFTVTLPAATNAEVVTGTTWSGATIVFKDSATVNQDACKGVTVNIGYTST